MFVTVFLGFLDMRSGTLTYINAGHPPPHLLRARGNIERVNGKPQAPLGVRCGVAYDNYTVQLAPADAVFVCSDGIAEAMNPLEELYTEARLELDLQAAQNAAPADIVRSVKEHVDDFTGTAAKADDVTMLALRWEPATT
jgi:phosphoserine phosphatase RsbU/P